MNFCNKCKSFTEHDIEFETIAGRRYTRRTCKKCGNETIHGVSNV